MSPIPPSPINPSQAVERIREIIVGRHLEKLEQRVVRLETGTPAPVSSSTQSWEDRLSLYEARLEALQHSVQKITESSRDESEARALLQREEIQRLATQIQQVAAMKAAENPQAAVQQLEQKLGSWLTNWQAALQNHLTEREERISQKLHADVASLWENTESQVTRLQSRSVDREQLEERFERIAEAARAFAETISPLGSGPKPASI
jgi:phage host-nuclease inhibitor protein Gam